MNERWHERWQHQLRVYLCPALAEDARRAADSPLLQRVTAILQRHRATLVSQLDAFEAYLAQAERDGPDRFPLYRWTKATLDDPDKRSKHLRAFAVHVDGHEVYPRAVADALEAALRDVVDGVTVTGLSRHDTNPANNLPVPDQYRA